MNTQDTICRLVEAMVNAKYKEEREYIRSLIDGMKTETTSETRLKNIEDDITSLKSNINLKKNFGR